MPKKYEVFFKSIGRKWFLFLVLIIIIIFIYNQVVAIWFTAITLVLFLLSYIPVFFTKNKMLRFMKGYYMVEDDTVAKEIRKPLREVREKMFDLSQDQSKKKWVIVFLNKRYIYFNKVTIAKFQELYHEGYSEAEILENMKDYDLRTRAEVKSIIETLKKLERLGERRTSVKQRQDQLRFLD